MELLLTRLFNGNCLPNKCLVIRGSCLQSTLAFSFKLLSQFRRSIGRVRQRLSTETGHYEDSYLTSTPPPKNTISRYTVFFHGSKPGGQLVVFPLQPVLCVCQEAHVSPGNNDFCSEDLPIRIHLLTRYVSFGHIASSMRKCQPVCNHPSPIRSVPKSALSPADCPFRTSWSLISK